jgi:two-component system chemotaxis response regulator CheB
MGKQVLPAGARIRVLVVDDSVVIRRLVTEALNEDPTIEVVGAAANGKIALAKIPQVNPDAITLDIEMPELDGLETLRRIRKDYPKLCVIMFSTLTERGARATLDALALGANDYVTKAANIGSLDRSMASLRGELIPKIKQFFALPGEATRREPAPGPAVARTGGNGTAVIPAAKSRRSAVAIGLSTGGPAALSEVLPRLPEHFPLPVLIVQHMPPIFTRLLADRLRTQCALAVEEAAQGMSVVPGKIIIARGDYHMRLRRSGAEVLVTLDQAPPENSCRPAVDVTFRAVEEVYRGEVVAVIMTGMGQDGLRGVEILKARGAYVIAQDEATSVVWGMPGYVAKAGLADAVVPLESVYSEIVRHV